MSPQAFGAGPFLFSGPLHPPTPAQKPTWMSTLSLAPREPGPPRSSSLEQPARSSCRRSTLRLRPAPSSCCRFSCCRAWRSRRCCSRLELSPVGTAWTPVSSPWSSSSSWDRKSTSEGHGPWLRGLWAQIPQHTAEDCHRPASFGLFPAIIFLQEPPPRDVGDRGDCMGVTISTGMGTAHGGLGSTWVDTGGTQEGRSRWLQTWGGPGPCGPRGHQCFSEQALHYSGCTWISGTCQKG